MGKAQPSKRHCWKRVEASVRTIGGVVMFWLKHNNPTRVVMFWPRIVVQTWGPGSPSVVSPPAWNNTLETSTNTHIYDCFYTWGWVPLVLYKVLYNIHRSYWLTLLFDVVSFKQEAATFNRRQFWSNRCGSEVSNWIGTQLTPGRRVWQNTISSTHQYSIHLPINIPSPSIFHPLNILSTSPSISTSHQYFIPFPLNILSRLQDDGKPRGRWWDCYETAGWWEVWPKCSVSWPQIGIPQSHISPISARDAIRIKSGMRRGGGTEYHPFLVWNHKWHH